MHNFKYKPAKNAMFTHTPQELSTIKQPAPALLLMGPTASGKTALAVSLAQALDAEIISVDSALVYRGMDIGTAKPTIAERGGIPHHLLDILDPCESYSTGQFLSQAHTLIAEIQQRGKLPILVGGTMLYFNALTQGMAELPTTDAAVRAQLDAEFAAFGKEYMHQQLAKIDPESATRIHPNDPQRIQRALEVYRLTGQSMSSLIHAAEPHELPFQPIKLVLAPHDRALLHSLIAQRFHTMLAQGLVAEVASLRQRGDLNPNLPSMRAVGYRQVWAYLQGEISHAAMIEQGIAATRQLAKRQFTWLRRETEAKFVVSGQAQLVPEVMAYLASLHCL